MKCGAFEFPATPREVHRDHLRAHIRGALGPAEHADQQRLLFIEQVTFFRAPAERTRRGFRATMARNLPVSQQLVHMSADQLANVAMQLEAEPSGEIDVPYTRLRECRHQVR